MRRRPQTSTLIPFFFFNDTATTEIYTLSLHDALPILDETYKLARRIAAGPPVAIALTKRAIHHNQDVDLRSALELDRKSTRLNSSHANISYAVFCLKKKIQSCYTLACRFLLSHKTFLI